MPTEQREALTIISVKDLSFCLEYRSVEVRGVEVELTEKEFDIFTLLLTNPKKVFTYEMIMNEILKKLIPIIKLYREKEIPDEAFQMILNGYLEQLPEK